MSLIQACAVLNAEVEDESLYSSRVWDSVELEKLLRGMVLPKSGQTFLYGPPEGVKELLIWKAKTLEVGISFADVVVEIGKWNRRAVRFEDIEQNHFFNVHRSDSCMQRFLSEFWAARIGAFPLVRDTWPRGATAYPHIIDELHAEYFFKHLNAIAYSIKTPEFGDVPVVTVFKKEKLSLFSLR